MPDAIPPPAPESNDRTPKRARSAQDKFIAAYIADARKFLKVASEDAEIRTILEAHGTFMKELKGTARGALRGKPGLLAKLEM